MRADPWYRTIFLFLERWSTHLSWALAWILSRCVMKWWELRDSLADFLQRLQGLRQRRRTRALPCTLMLWFNGKGVFFRVENSFNFALWMNKILSPASYSRKFLCLFCREKFCKKTVYSGIELICEFAKIWLIITKTCFDSFLLFLLVWILCKSFWKPVWRVRVLHLHSAARALSSPSQCFQIVKKSWKRFLSLSFVLKYYNNFHQRSPKGYQHHVSFFHIVKLYTAKIK